MAILPSSVGLNATDLGVPETDLDVEPETDFDDEPCGLDGPPTAWQAGCT